VVTIWRPGVVRPERLAAAPRPSGSAHRSAGSHSNTPTGALVVKVGS
jgi:hypothetical protein